MERTIKELPAENGELYVTSAGQRRLLAKFDGRVEIIEHQTMVTVLGTVHSGTKKIYASFIVCGDVDYQMEIDDRFIHAGKVFNATAYVAGERIHFDGLRFEDSDPIKNELIFEITDIELILELLKL